MENTSKNQAGNKNLLLIGGVVIVLLILVGGYFVMSSKSNKKAVQTEDVLPSEEAIPTVDSSVMVDLKATTGNKEVILTIKNPPKDTESIEYELSYLSKGTLPKGVIGTINLEKPGDIERKITLGTCSSGTCVYDTGVESVKVSLKFNSPSGSKAFEKEYKL